MLTSDWDSTVTSSRSTIGVGTALTKCHPRPKKHKKYARKRVTAANIVLSNLEAPDASVKVVGYLIAIFSRYILFVVVLRGSSASPRKEVLLPLKEAPRETLLEVNCDMLGPQCE